MNKRSIVFASVLVLSLVSVSCARREDKVVARVGGKLITVGDVERRFRAQPDWSSEEVDSAKMAVLNSLIDEKLLAVEGDRLGYRDDEEITKGLDELKNRAVVGQLYQKVVVERARVGEGEVRRYYDRMAEEVKVRHILVATQAEGDSIYAQVSRGGGESFEEAARLLSTDKRTASTGGDLGWVRWGRMPDEFTKVAFSLKVGEMSRPVKTDRGYHIIKTEDRREVERRPWDEEKGKIRSQLEREKMKRLGQEYWDNLKKRARIEVDEEVLKVLADKTPKQPRDMFRPPPLPTVTEEDRQMVLVSSALGDWTVDRVLGEAEKLTRRPGFDQPEARGLVEWLVINELLMNEAKRYHLDRSPKVILEVENRIDEMVTGKLTQESDAKALASEEELSEYYKTHIDEFTRPERVKASLIVVSSEEEAKEIERKLRVGADFAKLAGERSTHRSKARGGDLGLFARGTHPEIEEVAFRLKRGSISAPIATREGFAIVKVTGKEPSSVQPFEEVKSRIEGSVLAEKREMLRKEILERLRGAVEVAIGQRNLRIVGAQQQL